MDQLIDSQVEIKDEVVILLDNKNFTFDVDLSIIKNDISKYISISNYIVVSIFLSFTILEGIVIDTANYFKKKTDSDADEQLKESLIVKI